MLQIPSAKRITGSSPIVSMKAIKNPVEIQGMRNAHLKDAVALCDFLALLEKEVSRSKMTSKPPPYLLQCNNGLSIKRYN